MKSISLILTLFFSVALVGVGFGQSKMKTHTMTGYLTDKMCSKRFLGENGAAKAAKHSKSCALEDDCKASGYGLIHEGKFYKFDEAGDKKALEYLNTTKKEKDIMVEVTGTMEGETLKVMSISEAKPMDKKMEHKKEEKMQKKGSTL